MIWWKLYSRKNPSCEYCRQAKELLDLYGIDYYEIDLDDLGVRDYFKERGFRTVPQIFREDQHIGGFNALEQYLKDEQIDKEKEYRRKGRKDEFHSA
jgi:glutaredoxin 3